MMRYKLPSCKCVLLQDVINGEVVYAGIESACPFHLNADTQVVYNNAHDNMLRHSHLQNKLMTDFATQLYQTGEGGTLIVKNGVTINYDWSGTGENRVLNLSVTGYNLSNNQKTAIQTWCDSNLGIGKCVVG